MLYLQISSLASPKSNNSIDITQDENGRLSPTTSQCSFQRVGKTTFVFYRCCKANNSSKHHSCWLTIAITYLFVSLRWWKSSLNNLSELDVRSYYHEWFCSIHNAFDPYVAFVIVLQYLHFFLIRMPSS